MGAEARDGAIAGALHAAWRAQFDYDVIEEYARYAYNLAEWEAVAAEDLYHAWRELEAAEWARILR